MKIVRMLHPYCIPIFGYIAGGDEIGMPENIADAMVATGYAEYVETEPVIVSGRLPPVASSPLSHPHTFEPPTEVLVEESRKSKRKNWSAAEDTLIEESN